MILRLTHLIKNKRMKKIVFLVAFIAFQFGYSQVPDRFLPENAKFLKASEIGLVKMDYETAESPFTSQEYQDAYNNGLNLSAAIEKAHEEGYSMVVLEKGSYPMTANAGSSTVAAGSGGYCAIISNIEDMTIDFNGATFFIIYDSVNRNPYDATANDVYDLGFKMISLRQTENISIINLELRGDNYMRSWVEGEAGDIPCYGIVIEVDSQNIKIDNYEGHGFRCEPLAITYKGYNDKTISTFYAGGLDASGAEIVETGSYRTAMLDMTTGITLVDNSFSIIGWGFTREIPFRNSLVRVFYYTSSDEFITSDWSIQNKLNYLPANCTKVRFVAYDDERTDPTVNYSSVALTSGTPRNLLVANSKFYNNMRGGIAGVSNNTTIMDCVFHTIGKAITYKYGWMSYDDTTQFAINIEDGMPDFVKIVGNRFEDCGHAFLTPAAQTLIFNNNVCQDIQYDSSVLNCKYAEVMGNTFVAGTDIGGGLSVTYSNSYSEKTAKVANNLFIDAQMYARAVNNKNNTIYIDGNTYINTNVRLEGNVISANNYHHDFVEPFKTPVDVVDVIRFDDYIEERANLSTWELYTIDTRNNDSRARINVRNTSMRFDIESENVPSLHYYGDPSGSIGTPWSTSTVYTQNFNGTKFENIVKSWGDGISHTTLPDYTANFIGSEFVNSELSLNRRVTSDAGDMVLNFTDCVFDMTDLSNLRILNNGYANVGGTLTMNFKNCKFISDTAKTINVTSGTAITGLSINMTGCETDNITFNYAVTPVLKFKTQDVNCPSYADNATALAAIGEGFYYKNTTSGEYEITHQ